MKPIKFKIIEKEISDKCWDTSRVHPNWLDEFVAKRPDVLKNIDFFLPGLRSQDQHQTRFDLFCEVDDNPEIYVSPLYIELLEFGGLGDQIVPYIKCLCEKYKDNIVMFQWNHDNDFAKYSTEVDKIENARIINMGDSSVVGKNDILVHRWIINTKPYKEEKKYFASFIGSINNQYRYELAKNIINAGNNKISYQNNIPHDKFLSTLSSTMFSLCPLGGPGQGGFSYRFFECLHLNTIPVLMVDNIIFPYQDRVDWNNLCVRISQKDSLDINQLIQTLESVDTEKILRYINDTKDVFTLGGAQETIYRSVRNESW